MTDEERKNRNPAPEVATLRIEDCPELRVSDLELHRAYILQGPRLAASLNYAGKQRAMDPVTGDAVMLYLFDGPRANLHVALVGYPDGTLHDLEGAKVTLRRYTGPDA